MHLLRFEAAGDLLDQFKNGPDKNASFYSASLAVEIIEVTFEALVEEAGRLQVILTIFRIFLWMEFI